MDEKDLDRLVNQIIDISHNDSIDMSSEILAIKNLIESELIIPKYMQNSLKNEPKPVHSYEAQLDMAWEEYENDVKQECPNKEGCPNKVYPNYVTVGIHGTALCYTKRGTYYRHAGEWEVGAEFDNDGILRISRAPFNINIIGCRLFPTSLEEWKEDNCGYV